MYSCTNTRPLIADGYYIHSICTKKLQIHTLPTFFWILILASDPMAFHNSAGLMSILVVNEAMTTTSSAAMRRRSKETYYE